MNPTIEGNFTKKGEEEVVVGTFEIDKENETLAFEVLSAQMYSNKEKVVVQEYMCNARDAHREIGKCSVPIEVTLPSEEYLFLEIKDHGPGISEDRMDKIFRKYFASSKRMENGIPQTGGYGLGAKCAWAYCAEFWILTTCDNYVYEYRCFKNEDGKRQVSLISKSVATPEETNGTTIKVPVKSKDVSLFTKYLTHTAEFWGVKPIVYKVIGGKKVLDQIRYMSNDFDFVGNGWKISFSKAGVDCREATAIVDDIQYPILYDMLAIDNKVFKNIIESNIFIEFPKDEVIVSPNREQLQYTATTKNSIVAKLQVISEEMGKWFADIIGDAKSILEAREKIYADNNGKNLYKIIEGKKKNLKWNDAPIFCESIGSDYYQQDDIKKKFNDVSLWEFRDGFYDTSRYVQSVRHIEWSGLKALIINDKKTYKLKKVFSDIVNKLKVKTLSIVYIGKIEKKDRAAFYADFKKKYEVSDGDYTVVSKFLKKNRIKTVVKKEKIKVSISGEFSFYNTRNGDIVRKFVNLADYCGIYLESHYGKKCRMNGEVVEYNCHPMGSMVAYCNYPEIVLVPPKLMDDVAKLKNMSLLNDFVERKYLSDRSMYDFDELYVKRQLSNKTIKNVLVPYDYNGNFDGALKMIYTSSNNPTLGRYYTILNVCDKLTPEENSFLNYCTAVMNMNTEAANEMVKESELIKAIYEIQKKFPLLIFACTKAPYSTEVAKELVQYVNSKEN